MTDQDGTGENTRGADGTERQLAPLGPESARLLIVARDGTWSAHPLPDMGWLSLGRGAEADVRIEERSVSRLHARLEVRSDRTFFLTDLGSANGTGVGQGVIQSATVEVKPGQPMLFGRTVVVIQLPLSPAAEAPAALRDEPARPSKSTAMLAVEALVAKMAKTHVNVLLLGETGVGKDVFAERLHRLSSRSGPLMRLNCAGLAPALLESELFGHEKGAFTGAVQSKKGLLEVAAGGTVLLDEIGEMPLEVQAKLLLALEQRAVRRIGATQATPIDVRFICATHRDLEAEIKKERFRADFYYRINGIAIRIPPLRERLEELHALCDEFARDTRARLNLPGTPDFHADARAALRKHDWPGNIRELRNVVERAVLFSDGVLVTRENLIAAELPVEGSRAAPAEGPNPIADSERERIVQALNACAGNQSRAAKLLGISRNTLIARIREFGLARPRGG